MFFDEVRYAYKRKHMEHQRGSAMHRKLFDPFGFFDKTLKQLDTAIPFAVNNVARYVERSTAGATEERPMNLAHLFPCVAPLGPECWFEFDERYDGHGDQEITSNGVLLCAFDMQDAQMRASMEYLAGYIKQSGLAEPVNVQDGDHRWLYTAMIFTKDRSGRVAAHPTTASLRVFEDGTPHPDLMSGYANPALRDRLPPDAEAAYWSAFASVIHIALASIAFSHCKNVTVVPHVPSSGEQKHALVMGRPPVVTYHTIEIDPTHAVVKHEQARVERGEVQPKALHIVRGHFAEYSPEKPLFGNPKNVGRFFIPMHARGTAKAGTIVKDYNVLPTKGDQ